MTGFGEAKKEKNGSPAVKGRTGFGLGVCLCGEGCSGVERRG